MRQAALGRSLQADLNAHAAAAAHPARTSVHSCDAAPAAGLPLPNPCSGATRPAAAAASVLSAPGCSTSERERPASPSPRFKCPSDTPPARCGVPSGPSACRALMECNCGMTEEQEEGHMQAGEGLHTRALAKRAASNNQPLIARGGGSVPPQPPATHH